MRFILFSILFLTIFHTSCKKENIDEFVFEGTWKWEKTTIAVTYISTERDTIISDTNYELEFKKRGILKWYIDDELENKYTITDVIEIDELFLFVEEEKTFEITLCDEEKTKLRFSYQNDGVEKLLVERYFPYSAPDEDHVVINYFVRKD